MPMDDQKFNRWFSAFILIGMTVALVLTTAIKIGRAPGEEGLLLLAAFGSLMGVLATVSSANGHIITFLFGLLDVAIYGAMCLMNWHDGGSGLGNAVLHFAYFVPMQFVGFFQWRRRGSNTSGQVHARRLNPRQWPWVILAFVVSTVVMYFVIARFDRSAAQSFLKMAVILDVLPLVCNVFGQMLMSTAYREQWFFWIGVNVFSIWMWARSLSSGGGSYALIYIIKYSFYLINSLNGLRIWHNLSKGEDVCK